jgi:hypothetical protein
VKKKEFRELDSYFENMREMIFGGKLLFIEVVKRLW